MQNVYIVTTADAYIKPYIHADILYAYYHIALEAHKDVVYTKLYSPCAFLRHEESSVNYISVWKRMKLWSLCVDVSVAGIYVFHFVLWDVDLQWIYASLDNYVSVYQYTAFLVMERDGCLRREHANLIRLHIMKSARSQPSSGLEKKVLYQKFYSIP